MSMSPLGEAMAAKLFSKLLRTWVNPPLTVKELGPWEHRCWLPENDLNQWCLLHGSQKAIEDELEASGMVQHSLQVALWIQAVRTIKRFKCNRHIK